MNVSWSIWSTKPGHRCVREVREAREHGHGTRHTSVGHGARAWDVGQGGAPTGREVAGSVGWLDCWLAGPLDPGDEPISRSGRQSEDDKPSFRWDRCKDTHVSVLKTCHKDRPSVRDNDLYDIIMADNVWHIELGILSDSASGEYGDKVDWLSQAIHNDPYRVVPT
jgi:hypothetical protein